jgi:hypothetical protein
MQINCGVNEKSLMLGEIYVISFPLVLPEKIYLPPLYKMLGLKKNLVKN